MSEGFQQTLYAILILLETMLFSGHVRSMFVKSYVFKLPRFIIIIILTTVKTYKTVSSTHIVLNVKIRDGKINHGLSGFPKKIFT